MSVVTLTGEIGRLLGDISVRRNEIKEHYIKTWLAANIPDDKLNLDWIINNLCLQEQWSADRLTVTWRLVERKPKDGV